MSLPDFAPAAVTERLRLVAALADLDPARRLATKVDLSAAAVTRRLRRSSELRRLCLRCAEWGRQLRD